MLQTVEARTPKAMLIAAMGTGNGGVYRLENWEDRITIKGVIGDLFYIAVINPPGFITPIRSPVINPPGCITPIRSPVLLCNQVILFLSPIF